MPYSNKCSKEQANNKKGFYIMKNTFTLPVSGAEDMQQVVTDLLATSEQAYNFIVTLQQVLEDETQQATTEDLSNFARLIEDFNGLDNYYASELLYMLGLAFKEVEG